MHTVTRELQTQRRSHVHEHAYVSAPSHVHTVMYACMCAACSFPVYMQSLKCACSVLTHSLQHTGHATQCAVCSVHHVPSMQESQVRSAHRRCRSHGCCLLSRHSTHTEHAHSDTWATAHTPPPPPPPPPRGLNHGRQLTVKRDIGIAPSHSQHLLWSHALDGHESAVNGL